jgi:hypothetical protein
VAALALAVACLACSRLYGLKLRAEAGSPLAPACIDAALAPLEHVERTQHREDWIGWELPGPAGATRVDLVGEREVSVSWTRINRPFPAADCVRMKPFVDGLYDRVRAACPALPATARELDIPCAE